MDILQSSPSDKPIEFDEHEHEEDDHGLFVSEESYWAEYYHSEMTYEWNNGYLEERPTSNFATSSAFLWLVFKVLGDFLEITRDGRTTGLGMGFRLALPHKTTIRRPDMGFVLNDNAESLKPQDYIYGGIFDLCIEAVASPATEAVEHDTVVKKSEYEQIGVKELYILDGFQKETAFYRLNQSGKYEEIKPVDGDVIQSQVLPGFQFRISDLYRQPSRQKLLEDEVYQDFIMPWYQAAEKRAKQAQKRRKQAEEERKRAEKERKEKEYLVAVLKEMGISVDDSQLAWLHKEMSKGE